MRAEEILNSGLKLLASKGQDYCEDREANQYQNFERSNLIASWFKHDEDKSYAVLIGTKLARLASLLNSSRKPNNESILDSFIDGANYFALWGGKRMRPTVEELDKILNSEPDAQPYDKPAGDNQYNLKSNPSIDAANQIMELSQELEDRDLDAAIRFLQSAYQGRMMTNFKSPTTRRV